METSTHPAATRDGGRSRATTGAGGFFSSRRRHTRSDRDWSSDVCSSDLLGVSERQRLEHRLDGGRPPTHRGSFGDRKSGVEGKRVDLGGRRIIKKKKKNNIQPQEITAYNKRQLTDTTYNSQFIVEAFMPADKKPAIFFFSSRRRHTISDRDWSSDVCSSDLQIYDFFCLHFCSAQLFVYCVNN